MATLSTTDANPGDTHSYSIVSDPSGKFEIVGDEIRVRAGQTVDYETEPSFTLTVRTTDADGQTHDEVLTLTTSDFAGSHTAGPGGESVTGTSEEDTITGGLGDDTLAGGAGDDVIDSGGGSDVIDGGTGTDTVIFPQSFDDTELTHTGSGASLVITVTDTTTGASTDVSGAEVLQFSDRTLTVSDMILGSGTLAGDGAANVVVGAEASADTLTGGLGDDALFGGTGDDSLSGGSGDDRLVGGGGSDVVVFGGDLTDFAVSYDAVSDSFTVTDGDAADGLDEGTDTVSGVESFSFNGTTYTADQIRAYADGSAPTAITIASGGTVAETVASGGTIAAAYDPSGSTVATLSTTDASGAGDTHSYSIVSDPSGKFEIVGDEDPGARGPERGL